MIGAVSVTITANANVFVRQHIRNGYADQEMWDAFQVCHKVADETLVNALETFAGVSFIRGMWNRDCWKECVSRCGRTNKGDGVMGIKDGSVAKIDISVGILGVTVDSSIGNDSSVVGFHELLRMDIVVLMPLISSAVYMNTLEWDCCWLGQTYLAFFGLDIHSSFDCVHNFILSCLSSRSPYLTRTFSYVHHIASYLLSIFLVHGHLRFISMFSCLGCAGLLSASW